MSRIMSGLVLVLATANGWGAGPTVKLDQAQTDVANIQMLQRGARMYVNYCGSCHSAQYLRYRRLMEDLGLTEAQVKENLIFSNAKIGETMTIAMRPEHQRDWFGAPAPDLSLISRSRGSDWLYTYLKSFYLDPDRPLGWNNTVFPQVSMPNPLWELQGIQEPVYETVVDDRGESRQVVAKLKLARPGSQSAAEFDDSLRDLVTFLEYVGEPAKMKRESVGIWVLLYLVLFTFLAYLLKLEYWRDVR